MATHQSSATELSPKAKEIGAMFSNISGRYDLLNRLMTLGFDKRWRNQAVRALEIPRETTGSYLDLATGTADLALALAQELQRKNARHPCVHGADLSFAMLCLAQRKVQHGSIDLCTAAIEQLPYPNSCFAGITIGFGIRNVVDRLQGLREIARVLQPGGRLVILEAVPAQTPWQRMIQRLHMQCTVRLLGSLLSDASAYRYLGNSVQAFPTAHAFLSLLKTAGFQNVQFKPLTAGSVGLFIAQK